MQGVSFADILAGKNNIQRNKPIFWQWKNGGAVRDGKWKIVKWQDNRWALYDMNADRSETHDLSKQKPEKLAEMIAMYEKWHQQVTTKN